MSGVRQASEVIKIIVSHALAADQTTKHPPIQSRRPSLLGVGVIIWLGSEFMFFSGIFAAFFTLRAHAPTWPPPGIKVHLLEPTVFTLVLVASLFTMRYATWGEEHGSRLIMRRGTLLTLALGSAFLADQAYTWTSVAFKPSTNAYGSLFFIMTGVHGIHIIAGLLVMAVLLFRMTGVAGDPGELAVIQSVSYYWYFVVVVWVGMYACLYLLSMR